MAGLPVEFKFGSFILIDVGTFPGLAAFNVGRSEVGEEVVLFGLD